MSTISLFYDFYSLFYDFYEKIKSNFYLTTKNPPNIMVARNKIVIALLPLFGLTVLTPQTLAQSIVPTPDSTGTVIQHNGNTYTISGGTQAGVNLFHSFGELGLSPNEIANFLSNPNIQNILGRVTGRNPSLIQGLLQVIGGNSNLLLMNPAGIVFTQNATLDLPGSFTATTADAIGFENGFFTATGNNNYQTLVGAPNQFIFAGNNNGSIVNAAQLEVSQGNLALIGSSVINTGTLSAPNGNITIAAVPDSKAVRINQEGMVLGLEIAPSNLESGIVGTDIARLLTDPNLQDATGVSVGSNGELRLTGSNISLNAAGNVTLASSVAGNEVHLAAAGDIHPIGNPETLIRTHGGQYSAPTVTRFARNSTNPNAYIFLDATVPDYSDFLFGGKAGTTTVVVVPTENGIEKITETLATPELSLVDQLHIISEGSEGNFWLGNAFIDSDSIGAYQSQMAAWSEGLNVGADILLYACLVALGSRGEALLDTVANYTGADVAGSTNFTGLGGDWDLERRVGDLEANMPFEGDVLAGYRHRLAVFTVENGNDAGADSLREEITNANNTAGDDEIRFAPGITQVTLDSGQLNINTTNGGLTIDGDFNGAINVIVERDTTGMLDFRIFRIVGDGDVTFDALTIRNGNAGGSSGGGIRNNGAGTLTLTNSTVSGNETNFPGGGIFSQGAVTLTNSTVSDNSAGFGSGGIYSQGAVTLTNSTVSDNEAANNGGGIYSRGAVTLTNSTVSGNIAGAEHGGIYSRRAVTLTNSTVSGNSAGGNGGGIFSDGTVMLTNSTVSGNSAGRSGGGIRSELGGTLTNSTITNNTADSDSDGAGDGGGIFRGGGTFAISNSIIAGNFDNSPAGNIHPDVSGDDINGDANNLIGDITGATGTSTIGTGSDLTFATAGITDISGVLTPLADNGGATQTHALIPGSPALDAGDNGNVPMGVTTDQRGAARIFTFNTAVDIGAVEMQFALLPTGTPQSTQVETAFAMPLSAQLFDTFTNQALAFAGLEVTFSAPTTGASGSLGSGLTVFTDARGNAANPFTANAIEGSYQVTAEAIGTQAATFDLENTAVPVTPTPVTPTPIAPTPVTPVTPTPVDPVPVVLPPEPDPQLISLIAPPESNTLPAPQVPPSALSETTLACAAAADPSSFAPLDARVSAIAGLMNASGGTLSASLDRFAECGNLASLPGNQQLAEGYLKRAVSELIGDDYDDLVQVRFVSSVEGATALVEVQPSPQPAFVKQEGRQMFYLYEEGDVRVLDTEAVEQYIQQHFKN